MAEFEASNFPNISDWVARNDPNGSIANIVDILSKRNKVVNDIPWVEGNLPTGHRITQTSTGLPSASWRMLNRGVAAVKGETAQFDETCGILETVSKVDVDVAKLNGNAAAYRSSEDRIIIEGISQQLNTAVFYESASTNPERIHGLSPRYPATTGYTASSYTLTGADGTYTNTTTGCHSVWLISWEPRKVYGIYPKGSSVGLSVEDKGEQYVSDGQATARDLWAYVTKFQWKCGIAVEDYRYCVRSQYDLDDAAFADTDKGMPLMLQRMIGTIHEVLPSSRFYMNRTSYMKLHAQLASTTSNLLEWIDQGGMRIPTYMGVPIRVCDELVTETAIT